VSSNGVANIRIPSNKWWTDLIIHQYSGNLWASPLAVYASAQRINISRPDFNTTFGGGYSFLGVNSQPEVPLAIRGHGCPTLKKWLMFRSLIGTKSSSFQANCVLTVSQPLAGVNSNLNLPRSW